MDKQGDISLPSPTRIRSLRSGRSIQRAMLGGVRYLALVFAALVVAVPILWMLLTSFKPDSQIQAYPPQLLPAPISFKSYIRAFQLLPMGKLFLNSAIIAFGMVASNVVFCSMAGYTFARKRFFGKDFLFGVIVASMMIPMATRLIPTYLFARNLGLQDTYPGLILPWAVTGFGIFMMRQFFISLPSEIEDAARVDGCSDWGVLFRIVLPISTPAVVSLGLFALVWSFEDLVWPLIITSSPLMRPLQVGITMFIGLVIYEWGPVMAMTSMMVMPLIIIYIFAQRGFIRGLTAGAVKN